MKKTICILVMFMVGFINTKAQNSYEQNYFFEYITKEIIMNFEIVPLNDTVFCIKHTIINKNIDNDYFVLLVGKVNNFFGVPVEIKDKNLFINVSGINPTFVDKENNAKIVHVPANSQNEVISYCEYFSYNDFKSINWFNIGVKYVKLNQSVFDKIKKLGLERFTCDGQAREYTVYSISLDDLEKLFDGCVIRQRNFGLFN